MISSLSRGREFITNLGLDYIKLRFPQMLPVRLEQFRCILKLRTGWDGILDDTEVEIRYNPYYEDNRFSYEYGSIHGIHDPGSGYIAEEIVVVATTDVYVYDSKGKSIFKHKVLTAGSVIDSAFLLKLDDAVEADVIELETPRKRRFA